MLIRKRVHGFINKVYETKFGIKAHGVWVPKHMNVIAILGTPEGKVMIPGNAAQEQSFVKMALGQMLHDVGSILEPGRAGNKYRILGSNIVTNDGDLHYAQRGANEAPTNFTSAIMEVATAGTPGKTAIRSSFTNVTASQKAIDGTYPQTNDGDADNTGAGTDIVTWLTSWTKADFNQTNITHGIVTNTTPAAGEVLLTGYAFAASFNKTADDTLKVFVNHEMLGV